MIDPLYAETLFNHLYSSIDGYSVSNSARKHHGCDTEKFLYGEVPFQSWKDILLRANPKKDSVFFDLGSGTGRIVMASHLLSDFRKCVGVEILKGLFEKSCEVKAEFEKNIKPKILEHSNEKKLEFICSDIFSVNLAEAGLIFMNHPFKDEENFNLLEEKFLDELKPQAKIVTTIRSLKNKRFKNLGSHTYNFSWGDSTAHFFEI